MCLKAFPALAFERQLLEDLGFEAPESLGSPCLGEAVEEGLGQPLARPALVQRVLAGEDAEGWRAAHGDAEVWQEDLPPVVQHRVEALEDGLAGQVELVQEDPVARLEGLIEGGRGGGGRGEGKGMTGK